MSGKLTGDKTKVVCIPNDGTLDGGSLPGIIGFVVDPNIPIEDQVVAHYRQFWAGDPHIGEAYLSEVSELLYVPSDVYDIVSAATGEACDHIYTPEQGDAANNLAKIIFKNATIRKEPFKITKKMLKNKK